MGGVGETSETFGCTPPTPVGSPPVGTVLDDYPIVQSIKCLSLYFNVRKNDVNILSFSSMFKFSLTNSIYVFIYVYDSTMTAFFSFFIRIVLFISF